MSAAVANHAGGRPVREGELLWSPGPERLARARGRAFREWAVRRGGPGAAGYDDLWRWSVTDLEGFWTSLASYFGLASLEGASPVLVHEPGTTGAEGGRFFPGATLNYADQFLRQPPAAPALVATAEQGRPAELSYGELAALAGEIAAGLAELGVERGDRVAAVLPNGVAAVAGFLAAASLGATWSTCAPEFGTKAMVDRLAQVRPKVLLAADGYRYGGRAFDLGAKVEALEDALDGLAATVLVPTLAGPTAALEAPPGPGPGAAPGGLARPRGPRRMPWQALRVPGRGARLDPVPVPFSHPLWILYSSGTTGLPKPIVHGHGGIVLEHLKALGLHHGIGPGDRFCWYTTTGWMMWNYLVGGLLVGATIVCYDGHPAWPEPDALFRVAAETGVTVLGTSAPYLEACRRSGVVPRDRHDLRAVRSVGSTGAPLSPEGFVYASSAVGDDVLVASISGGTDVCTAFLTCWEELPVRAGELQCRALGAAVAAFDDEGRELVDQVGELVLTAPLPSMPVALWGDEGGQRLHEAYFAAYPGVWRHGDWVRITPAGSAVVYGRSDATLNRGGVRMGTAELYAVVEALPEVATSLAVDTTSLGRDGELLLFVVPADPSGLDPSAVGRIREAVRDGVSPRAVPNRVVAVPAIPTTLNGKRVEVPVRRILLGTPVDEAIARDALADPAALDAFLGALVEAGLLPR